jgi:hypothetical protein
MPILGEGRVVWHLAIEAKPTEPAVGEVQVHLLAQPPFGTDAVAIANQQHPHEQLVPDANDPSVVANADRSQGVDAVTYELLVSEEGEEHFTLLADQAQKRSPCILLTFFKIGIANDDSLDRRVLNLSGGFGNCHSVNIE